MTKFLYPGVVAPLPDGPTSISVLDAPPESPCQLVVDADLRLEHEVVMGQRVNEKSEIVRSRRVQATRRHLRLDRTIQRLRPAAPVMPERNARVVLVARPEVGVVHPERPEDRVRQVVIEAKSS